MIPIPSQNRQWTVRHDSDLFGSIVNTRNLDFNRAGYVQLARKPMVLYTSASDVDFGRPIVFAANDDDIFVITNDRIFEVRSTSGSIVMDQVTNAGTDPTPGIYSDAVIFEDELHVSGDDDVGSFDGSTWTQDITGLSDDYPHPLCVSEHQNSLAVGDGNLVKLYSDAYALTTTLVLPQEYIVVCIRWRMDTLYIGTRNVSGGSAKVFLWNGAGTAAQQGYSVHADWVYSMCEYLSSMTVITSAGQLLRFNGGGFDEIPGASLPVYGTSYSWTDNSTKNNLIGKVASRGMAAVGNRLFINLNGQLAGDDGIPAGRHLPNMPSGLWVYDPNVGLYHKAGYAFERQKSLTPTSVESSYMVFGEPHGALTGDAVLCSGIGSLTGLNFSQVYYAIKDSDLTLRLALSPQDAKSGRSIDIGGTISTATFEFDTYSSVGATVVHEAAPLFAFTKERLRLFYGSEVLFAGGVVDGSMAEEWVLLSLGMGRNRGSFVSAKVLPSQVEDAYQALTTKYGAFILDSQELVIKYRSRERYGFPLGTRLDSTGIAEWVTASSFTVNTAGRDFKSAEVGDEIEIVEGAGAGYTAHITAIDNSSDTYTVTIDEELPVEAGQQFDFVTDNWTKLTTITNADLTESQAFDTSAIDDATAKWVQFKVELRGVNMAIEQLLISADTHRRVL